MSFLEQLTLACGPVIVLAYVLWAYRFSRRLKQNLPLVSHAALNRQIDVITSAAMGALIVVTAARLVLGSMEQSGITVMAEMWQYAALTAILALFQFRLKKVARGLTASGAGYFKLTLRQAVGGAIAAFSFFFVQSFCASFLWTLILHFKPASAARPPLEFGILAISILCGLYALILLAPKILRIVLPSRPITDSGLAQRLQAIWTKSGAPPAIFCLLELEHFKYGNVVVWGTKWGRGAFQPHVFISPSLIDTLAWPELEAILFHEAGHLVYHHLSKRRVFIFATLVIGALTFNSLRSLSTQFLPAGSAAPFVTAITAFLILLGFLILRHVVRHQEIDADVYAVGVAGADPSMLTSALTKTTLLNDEYVDKVNPQAFFTLASAHPTVMERQRTLQARLNGKKAGRPLHSLRYFLADLFTGARGNLLFGTLAAALVTLICTGWIAYPRYKLRLAIDRRDLTEVSRLLDRGVDPNRPELLSHATPLMWAAASGEPKIIKLLLNHGARFDAVDEHGDPRPLAAIAAKAGHVEVLRLLHEQGVSLTKPDSSGRTPLHLAAYHGRLRAVQYLVSVGVPITKRDIYGDTPFMLASEGGRFRVVRYLDQQGADINQSDNLHLTPLSIATAMGHQDIVRYLILQGARLDELNSEGYSALEIAHDNGFNGLETLLVTAGAEMRPHRPFRSIASTVLR